MSQFQLHPVIIEGSFGVMHLWQLGIRRVVTHMDCHMSVRQAEMIAQLVTQEPKIILLASIQARLVTYSTLLS